MLTAPISVQKDSVNAVTAAQPGAFATNLNVLALATYPIEAAATRYRIAQFSEPLAQRGIRLTLRPFLDSRLFASLYQPRQLPRTAIRLLGATLRRACDSIRAQRFDVLLVQREAMIFGPPVVEWLMTHAGRLPMVLDLDDATYVSYVSPTYGRLTAAFKWFSKTDDLIRWASIVTCGNRSIADYVVSKGGRGVIIPTTVDMELFRPAPSKPEREAPVLGWIGTHSTYPFLESIYPALQRLARTHRFRLKVVGAGRDRIEVPGVEVDSSAWKLDREVEDFQSFDVGLYPMLKDDWSVGKSGFKAIQYMAVGIPYVTAPVGTCAEIGEAGRTHLFATTQDEWCAALGALLSDSGLRRRMGEAGRRHALQHYDLQAQAEKLAQALRLARLNPIPARSLRAPGR